MAVCNPAGPGPPDRPWRSRSGHGHGHGHGHGPVTVTVTVTVTAWSRTRSRSRSRSRSLSRSRLRSGHGSSSRGCLQPGRPILFSPSRALPRGPPPLPRQVPRALAPRLASDPGSRPPRCGFALSGLAVLCSARREGPLTCAVSTNPRTSQRVATARPQCVATTRGLWPRGHQPLVAWPGHQPLRLVATHSMRGRAAATLSLSAWQCTPPSARTAASPQASPRPAAAPAARWQRLASPGGCASATHPAAAPRTSWRSRYPNLSESSPSTVHPLFFFFNRAKQSAIPRAAPSPRPVGSHWHGATLLPLARYSSPSRRALGTAGRHGRPGPGDTDSLSVIGGRTVTVAQAPGRTPGFCRPGHTLNTTPSSLASITMIIGAAPPLAVHHGQNRRHGHWHEARCYDLPLLPSAQTF